MPRIRGMSLSFGGTLEFGQPPGGTTQDAQLGFHEFEVFVEYLGRAALASRSTMLLPLWWCISPAAVAAASVVWALTLVAWASLSPMSAQKPPHAVPVPVFDVIGVVGTAHHGLTVADDVDLFPRP